MFYYTGDETLEVIEGYVYCDVHGAIHDEESDPYQDDTPCGGDDWRKVWASERTTKPDPSITSSVSSPV